MIYIFNKKSEDKYQNTFLNKNKKFKLSMYVLITIVGHLYLFEIWY